MLRYGSFKWASYLCEVGVGVETALIAHLAAALCTGAEVVPYAHQVSGFADRAEFAARHWGNLWYRVRGGGDAAAIWRCWGGPASPAATHIHLQAFPGHVTLTLFSLRLIGVMGGQPVPCPMTTLHACFRTWVWQRWSGRENGKNSRCYSCAVILDSSTYIYITVYSTLFLFSDVTADVPFVPHRAPSSKMHYFSTVEKQYMCQCDKPLIRLSLHFNYNFPLGGTTATIPSEQKWLESMKETKSRRNMTSGSTEITRVHFRFSPLILT